MPPYHVHTVDTLVSKIKGLTFKIKHCNTNFEISIVGISLSLTFRSAFGLLEISFVIELIVTSFLFSLFHMLWLFQSNLVILFLAH